MAVLFVSNFGLHGELLFSLISEFLPFSWEKAEFGKLRHELQRYQAIVIDCWQIPHLHEPDSGVNLLTEVDHPKVLLINFPPDFPERISHHGKSQRLQLICDSGTSQDNLIRKLDHAIRGSSETAKRSIRGIQLLTRREQEILARLTEGESNSIIATKLHLSEHTVKNHMYNIFRKIGVQNRLQACNWAKVHLVASQP